MYFRSLNVFEVIEFWMELYPKRSDVSPGFASDAFHLLEDITDEIASAESKDYAYTATLMLLFGFRISELGSISVISVDEGYFVSAYARKQGLYRVIPLSERLFKYLSSIMFGVRTWRLLPQKEFARRVARYSPVLVQFKKEKIKACGHLFRHLHVCLVQQLLNVKDEDINEFFRWKNVKTIESYKKLLPFFS